MTDLDLPEGTGAELARIFPEVAVEPAPALDDAEAAQFRLFDAYSGFIAAITQQRPLLVVLDDLHWSDKPSLLLLQHLARSLSRLRLLVVGTYRDTDLVRTHPLSEALAALNRETGLERITLRGLTANEVGSYIRATAQIEPPSALIAHIHEETEGNPFFLSEVVNLMTEEGSLTADSVSDIAVPDGVREALGRRLDRLSDEASELLKVAAVAGREFRYEDLAALGDHEEEALFELLEESLSARVVEEADAPGRYRFTHALMQETLIDELSTTRRVRLHGRIGEALEARWGDRADERATRLAQHFVEAATLTDRHAEKAMRYSLTAAGQAEEQFGWDDAARRYEDALALLTETDAALSNDEAEILESAANCYSKAASWRPGWRAAMRSRELYRGRADVVGFGRSTRLALMMNPPTERGFEIAREALALLSDAEPGIRAHLLMDLTFRGNRQAQDADDALREARELADQHDLPEIEARMLDARAHATWRALRFEDTFAVLDEAFDAFDALGDHINACHQLDDRARINLQLGRLDEAERAAAAAHEYSRAHHVRLSEQQSLVYLAVVHLAWFVLEVRSTSATARRLGAEGVALRLRRRRVSACRLPG